MTPTKRRPIWGWVLFIIVLGVVFCLGLLAASITQRRAEIATIYANKKVNIKGIEARNEIWGENYPREYETWKQTQEMDFKSKHLGNMEEDILESRPNMVILWAGYLFSQDYKAPRGHMYAIEDNRNTLRTGTPMGPEDGPQPATCWTCKSPDVPRMMKEMGVENFYKTKWGALGNQIVNPIGCADCHDPKTMNLVITRPALIEAFQRQGKDIKKATTQEMRSLVCAQCHVEYYFKGDGKYLTLPWDKGMTVESMEKYYDEAKFSDFTHALSRAPIIKAQHPDYEISSLGIHGQKGVSCADCHMPYKTQGAVKISDHHLMSPLKDIANTCQTCHRDSEANLTKYVYERQDKVLEIRDRVEQELVKAHIMAKYAWDHGAKESQMKGALQLIRQAQWRWDFGVASHGASFHAPVETQRILSHALDKSLLAQIEIQRVLTSLHVNGNVPMPDLSTKAKAQAYIGLDMKTIVAKKKNWIETVVPAWVKEAKEKKRLL